MLDITTNNPTSNISYYSYDISADEAAAELLADDDMMDPLFDEDWLHENNLDILFDLFEEEIESKAGADPVHNGSSTLFGTSPVTSYLFGTSPTIASALDLLYFDNQQQQQQQPTINNNSAQQQQQFTNAANGPHISSNTSSSSSSTSTTTTANNSSFNQSSNRSINNTFNASGSKKTTHRNSAQQVGSTGANASITNAMRIKRGMKRGQSEGVSLLAKPFSSNSAKAQGGASSSGSGSSSNSSSSSSKKDRKSDKTNNSKSDKTSAKITNFKSSIIIGNSRNNSSNRNGIDINYSKQNQQQQQQQQQLQQREKYYVHNCTQHVHYITGRSVIHEHAYAVRGH